MTLTFFFLMKAIPGDPFSTEKMADPVIIENIKAKYGLDRPLRAVCKVFKRLYPRRFRNFLHEEGLTTNDIISPDSPIP